MGRKSRIKLIQVSIDKWRLPADTIVVHIKLARPIKTLKELDELGLDFIDRPRVVTAEQLIQLIEKLRGD